MSTRGRTIQIRVSREELRQAKARAKAAGVPISELLRAYIRDSYDADGPGIVRADPSRGTRRGE